MKLIILAAGEGNRLRPYTNEIPKCMVTLAGSSLLSHQLSSIKKCKISPNKIALVGGYKIDALKNFNIKIFKNLNYSKTNMVTTLFCARDFMSPDEDLIISYGDIVYEEKVLNSVMEGKEEINIVADKEWERLWRLRMSNPLKDAETFIMDDSFYIKELGKKPISLSQIQAQYIGLIKIRKDMVSKFIDIYDRMDKHVSYDGKNFDNMYMTSFIQYLIESKWKVKATLINNGWLEVDTIEDLKSYEKLFNDGLLHNYCRL
jgi:L-glutamine-phosphate cytidylyltransferase